MDVLSLFDGISCARVAFLRAGIPIRKYYASEIDPRAIEITKNNFPDTIHLGDVRSLTDPPLVDFLIGGSPCIDLSIAKKDRKGLEGEKSSLFWDYVRILRHLKPRYFILENVASMPSKDRDLITKEMGVEPILIDASLVSAQSRKRLFWTNIPVPTLPKDREIYLKDVLQPPAEVDDRFITKNKKSFCLTATYTNVSITPTQIENSSKRKQRTLVKIGREIGRRLTEDGTRDDHNTNLPYQRRIETRNDDKCGTLTTVQKDNLVVLLTDRQKANLRDTNEKAHCLTSTNFKGSQANGTTLVEQCASIRKLTPIECERLMGLPDDYTKGVPQTHRYRCLGNAFNVDVIAHILREV